MDEHLVGYLLKALDSDTERQVGDYLRASPEGRTRLELLRQALEPLEADKEEIDPPADLHLRTLRHRWYNETSSISSSLGLHCDQGR